MPLDTGYLFNEKLNLMVGQGEDKGDSGRKAVGTESQEDPGRESFWDRIQQASRVLRRMLPHQQPLEGRSDHTRQNKQTFHKATLQAYFLEAAAGRKTLL